MKMYLKISYLSIMAFVSLYTMTLAQISTNPSEINVFVTGSESVVTELEVTNNGETSVEFFIPFFNQTAARPMPYRNKTGITYTLNPDSDQIASRSIIDAQRKGEMVSLSNMGANIFEAIATRENTNIFSLQSLNSNVLFQYDFENLEIEAQVFELISDEPFSGTIGGFNGNFVLNDGSGQIWANDLAVLITDGPDLIMDNILYQFGGFLSFGAQNFYRLFQGQSGDPGTAINETIQLDEAVDLENVYIWIGNAWINDTGNWTGSVSLLGEDIQPLFVTDVTPTSGILEPGETKTIEITASGEGFPQGSFTSNFSINVDDELIRIPMTLMVTGIPEVTFQPLELEFGEVFTGLDKSEVIEIQNNGTGTLVVTNIESSNPAFVPSFGSFELPPSFFALYPITFNPQESGLQSGIVTFETNDPESPIVEVSVSGTGVVPPVIDVTPQNLTFTLDAGQTTTGQFTISNTGDGDLNFTLPSFDTAERGGTDTEKLSIDILALESQDEKNRLVSDKILFTEQRQSKITSTKHLNAISRIESLSTQSSVDVLQNSGIVNTNNSGNSILLNFDEFTAVGDEFFLKAENVTGSLEKIIADFEIIESFGETWANDLTILFIESNDNTDIDYEDIVLQIGGINSYSPNRINWGMGNSGAPGTAVNITIELTEPIDLSNVSIWVGNGWFAGINGVWDGTVELIGLTDGGSYITDATPTSGTLAPGESVPVNISIDTLELLGGTYNNSVRILSNDPINPLKSVSVQLTVIGTPEINVLTEELNFDTTFVGGVSVLPIMVENVGTDVLEINSLIGDNPAFVVPETNFSIGIGQTGVIEVEFRPDNPGDFVGSITVGSNAESGDQIIAVSGSAVNPGLLSIEQESFDFTLAQGEMETTVLSLTNIGESDLDFSISFASGMEAGQRTTLQPEKRTPASFVWEDSILGINPSTQNKRARNDANTLNSTASGTIWDQQPTGYSGIFSMYFEEVQSGAYAADRFTVNDGAVIHNLKFSGFVYGNFDDLEQIYPSFGFVIYEDNNGKPAGNPDNNTVSPVFSFEAETGTDGLSINPNEILPQSQQIKFDMVELTGSGVVLQPGSYWIIVYAVTEEIHGIGWYWMEGESDDRVAHFIDPNDVFNIGATEWIGLENFFGDGGIGLAFTLEGLTISFLSASINSGTIVPGETVDIPLMIDASTLDAGTYQAEILVNTNSPQTPQGMVPFNLTIEPAEMAMRWVNLDKPSSMTIIQGEDFQVHGLMQSDYIMHDENFLNETTMWVGFNTQDIHPAMWQENVWIEGSLFQTHDDLAEFVAEAGANLEEGTYYFATRFKAGDSPMVYGGFHIEGGGFWQEGLHTSGELIVVRSTSSSDDLEVPNEFSLAQNYPNPFNPTTVISYTIPESAEVRLEVFNIQGQRVSVLVNSIQNAGRYNINFDSSNLSSGIYIYRLSAGSFNQTKKMTLIK